MEDFGYKYTDKFSHFVRTLNSKQKCSVDLKPNDVRNTDLLNILYHKRLRGYRKQNFKIGDTIGISKYDLPFQKADKLQVFPEILEIVAISSRKSALYTKQFDQNDITHGQVYQRKMIEVNKHWNLLQQSRSLIHV